MFEENYKWFKRISEPQLFQEPLKSMKALPQLRLKDVLLKEILKFILFRD